MFNPLARWDRHLPGESFAHEQPIEVGVVFKKGKMFPRWFVWNDRKYVIQQITYQWCDRRGEETLHQFTVSDGVNVYQIYFNSRYLVWRLDKVVTHE